MASFWKKISKTFLTLLLLVGVFFAGFAGLAPTTKASAVFNEQVITNKVLFKDTALFVTYAEDILVGVDDDGNIYRSTDGTANLTKTGVKLAPVKPIGLQTGTSTRIVGKFIAYNNGILVVPCFNSDNTVTMYYSSDFGITWKSAPLSTDGNVKAKPYTIVAGSGYFVVASWTTGCAFSNNKTGTIYSLSSDGKTWKHIFREDSSITIDVGFKYNNGYFINIRSHAQQQTSNDIFIELSMDCENWISIKAPKQNETNTDLFNNAFILNSTLYCIQDKSIYRTTNFSEDATWQYVADLEEEALYAEPYLTGAIVACVEHIYYLEFTDKSIVNQTTLFYDPNRYDFLDEFDVDIAYPDTIAIGKKYICVGFSGGSAYAGFGFDETKHAYFKTYKRNISHTVTFKDWNGNVISSVKVPDGDTLQSIANPSREGYNFVCWDYDITQPITSDLTITAQYQIKTYTVEFLDWNGQYISSVTKEHGSVLASEDIPTPVRDAYSFTGWDKDIGQAITNNLTFIAQYSRELTLTINYLEPYGTAGIVNQFVDMRPATKVFNYIYEDKLATEELKNWYKEQIIPWETDYAADGVYNYTHRLTGWDKELPSEITNNIIVNATYEELNTVTLVYYSQLRFLAYEEADGTDYYYTFIGYMTVDKLMADGEVINLEDFKHPDVNYHIYNASQNTFYNNLEHFEFLGWDKDITEPITEDVTITGQYSLPTITMRLFDSDNYFIGEMQQELSFMTIEDMQALEGAGATWDKIREGFRLFFSLQWGDLGGLIADSIDLSTYLSRVRQYHTADCQLLTAFVCVNTDYPEYGGIFNNGFVATSSPCLSYYTGTANENNMSFWINPIIFATTLYPLTCTVSYANALGSIVKTVTQVFDTVWGVISNYWWLILIVVLAIIFRKPLIAGITMLFGAIGKGIKKLSSKVKSKSKNSDYKKTEKEYTAVKKQSKKKEKR